MLRRALGLCAAFVLVLSAILASQVSLDAANDKAATPSPATTSNRLDHPFVAGFDRFHANDKSDAVSGGLLLLGELGCTACHSADDHAAPHINAKPAPLLGSVAMRADPKYLARFIANPHATKPGTTMPDVFTGIATAEAQSTATAITHYLASLAPSPWRASGPDMTSVAHGENLFHSIGCVACHAPRRPATQIAGTSAAAAIEEDETENRPSVDLNLASVPLSTKLHEKYSITSLATFLIDPLKVRAGGRMPRMNLSAAEAGNLANYLLKDSPAPPNLRVSYYEGSWFKLPEFERITPKSTGGATDFSLGPLKKKSNFTVTFDGFLRIANDGEYQFHLESDDGSRLFIDNGLVVDNDGMHAVQEKSGKVRLSAGLHPIRVAYLQTVGEAELNVSMEGPGIERQRIGSAQLTGEAAPQPGAEAFVVDSSLADRGREKFVSIGCANCHQLGEPHTPIVSKLPTPPALIKCHTDRGCLSGTPAAGRPHYSLNPRQQASIATAIQAIKNQQLPDRTPQAAIAATLTTFNCYACHKREDIGGVIRERDGHFTANQPDLGDEGRIPPLLTGVGDKLRLPALQAVLSNAAVARPYMDARMPQFGESNLHALAAHLAAADRAAHQLPPVHDNLDDAKRAGYQLVHANGLACISCHMFNGQKSLGIQAMDLTVMAERLRPEWFHRYMLDPPNLRPGTRMPQSFIGGKSTKTDIYDGDADRQINALWQYLSDGRRARQPEGLVPQGLELVVGDEAIIYRAFIDGAGTRGIGVGYPEEVNIAYDANAMRPALIWQGRFIDPSRHWSGRGDGFQPPAGDDVRRLVEGAPFAVLKSAQQPWPPEAGKQAGYRFRGYRLDDQRRPTFLYNLAGLRVEDFFQGAGFGGDRHLIRTLTLSADRPVEQLHFRAAAQQASINVASPSEFKLDGGVSLRIRSDGNSPLVRQSDNLHELLIPVTLREGKAQILIEYHW